MGLKGDVVDLAPAAPGRWKQFLLPRNRSRVVVGAGLRSPHSHFWPRPCARDHRDILLQLAVVSFGGAYALLAYMAQQAVETHNWMTAPEMVDGLGLARPRPGRLFS